MFTQSEQSLMGFSNAFGGMISQHTCDIDIDVWALYGPYTSCKLIRMAYPFRDVSHVRS